MSALLSGREAESPFFVTMVFFPSESHREAENLFVFSDAVIFVLRVESSSWPRVEGVCLRKSHAFIFPIYTPPHGPSARFSPTVLTRRSQFAATRERETESSHQCH